MKIRLRQTFVFVWRYLRPYRGRLALALIFSLVATGLELLRPVLVGKFVDFLSGNSGERDFFSALGYVALIIIGTGFFSHTNRSLALLFFARAEAPAMENAFRDGFARIQRFSADWHANTFAGGTLRRLSRGVFAIEHFSDRIFLDFIPLFLVALGIATIMFVRFPLIGGIVFIGMLVYVAVSVSLALRYVLPRQRENVRYDSRTSAFVADTLTSIVTVKSFGMEAEEDRRFARVTDVWRHHKLRVWIAGVVTTLTQDSTLILLQICLLTSAVYFWSRGVMTVGDVTFVVFTFQLLWRHLSDIGRRMRELFQAAGDLEDLVEFNLTAPQVADIPHAKKLSAQKGLIEFQKVTFTYSNQTRPTYKNFSLTIRPGERIALVGESGGGKTTLVKLLQRFYDVHAGAILIDGQNIATVTQASLRRALALVPQEPLLFHRSLSENIAYAKPFATRKEIIRAAKLAHAHEFITKLPEGYATKVGERGIKLSGGERQRVALARAILADAPILILDEATSSLDSVSENFIQSALEYLMRDRTTIVVAHRLSTIQRADRILVFSGGKIVEEGKHAALLKIRGGVYRRLYELQAGGFLGGEEERESAKSTEFPEISDLSEK